MKRLSESHKGKKLTEEQKKKIGAASSAAKTGVPRPDMRGDANPMRRPDVAEKVGSAHRGRPKSAEQRAKISEKLRGRNLSPEHRAKLRKETPSYHAAHRRVEAERGKASTHPCDHCGKQARDWALRDGGGRSKKGNGRHRMYSLVADDYLALCQSCHRRYDYGTKS